MRGSLSYVNYFFKLTKAYIVKFKAIIILGIVIGLIVFSAIGYIMPLFYDKNVAKIGVTGRYTLEELPEPILNKISLGLTRVNEQGVVEGVLASSWESKDGGKEWVFHLKDDVYWQDGRELKASDIKYEFNDVELKSDDEKTLSFILKEPFSPFPSVLTRPVFKKGLLGMGEWSASEVLFSGTYVQEITLANENKDKILYKFYPTSERTKTAFKLGHIDKIEEMLDPEPLSSWANVKLSQHSDRQQVITLFFNTKDNVLSEKSLRQALAYAIKKEGQNERALSPISPLSWAYNPQVKEYEYNPIRFTEIMDSLTKEAKEGLNIRLITSPSLLSYAEEIAKNWNEVGVPTNVQVSPVIPTEFQVFLTILDIPKDPDQYSLWHTDISSNISQFSNVRIDKFLEDGRSELDFETRRKIYLDFQRYLLEELPALFLYHPIYYTIERK